MLIVESFAIPTAMHGDRPPVTVPGLAYHLEGELTLDSLRSSLHIESRRVGRRPNDGFKAEGCAGYSAASVLPFTAPSSCFKAAR